MAPRVLPLIISELYPKAGFSELEMFSPQKSLDKFMALTYKESVILDTVYKI